MTLTSVPTGPEACLVIRPDRHLRRQLQAKEQPGEGTVFIIAPDCGSFAVLVARPGPTRGGAVVEGFTAANGNVKTENFDEPRSVNIRRCLESASNHLGL